MERGGQEDMIYFTRELSLSAFLSRNSYCMKLNFQRSILEVSLANSEEIRRDPYSKIITLKKYPNVEFCKAWIPWLHSQIPAETQTDNIPVSHKK